MFPLCPREGYDAGNPYCHLYIVQMCGLAALKKIVRPGEHNIDEIRLSARTSALVYIGLSLLSR